MLDFKNERKSLYKAIQTYLDPMFAAKGFRWTRDNFWIADKGWARKACSLGAFKQGGEQYVALVGGAGLLIHEYQEILIPRSVRASARAATIGGPIHWIDKRLSFDSGRFSSWLEFEHWLPAYRRAFEDCALPELERYENESDVLAALLQTDWLTSVRLSATRDRRGGLVTLMLAKREGKESALCWARAEIARIKAQESGSERPAQWLDLQRAVDHLSTC